MKWIKENWITLIVISGIVILILNFGRLPYKSELSGKVVRDCSDIYPSNPYNPGTGHYAGFEWAERVEPSSCGGNSQSFIEGCEERQEQFEDYENCEYNQF